MLRTTAIALLVLLSCNSHADTADDEQEWSETGQASFYASRLHGRPTASGEPYDETDLTAAHPTLPFETLVRVTNLYNNRSVTVRINDRGPFVGKRIIDVSQRAAEQLGMIRNGLVRVQLEITDPDTPE